MTEAATEIVRVRLSDPQNEVMASRSSIIANIAGQGGGKTVTLGLLAGWFVTNYPEAKGFVGANTYEQLSSSTLSRLFMELAQVYGLTEYDRKNNQAGHYVVGVKPPHHWTKAKYRFKTYNNIMSFWNGAIIFLGSLDNYKTHDGKEFGWAQLDETKDTKKEALTTVILGRLRQYGLWYKEDDPSNVLWAPMMPADVAKRQGFKSWNPCYIHTSPAEGNVDWLIDLLGIAPYEHEIKETITRDDDFWYKDLINVDEKSKVETATTVVIYSSYHNAENLPPGFLEARKSKLSAAEILKFIYGYPFGKNGGEYYPGFQRFKQVKQVAYQKELAIHSTWDFNATPYVTCLCSHIDFVIRYWDPVEKKKYEEPRDGTEEMRVLRFRFFKEYTMPAPDDTTEAVCDKMGEDYVEFDPVIFVNGDASGHSRIEGLGSLTNYRMVENGLKRAGFYLGDGWLRAKRSNIQNSKRRDLMNRIWEGKIPEVEIEIDEDMVNTIRDCEYLLKGKDGGKHKEEEKDKNGLKFQKLGHPSDAMEYLICEHCKEFLTQV